MMILRFEPPNDMCIKIFHGPGDLHEHWFAWMEKWCDRTTEEWVHLFIHALGPIPVACISMRSYVSTPASGQP